MIENLLSWLAPHRCVGCRAEGSPLCSVCFDNLSEQPWNRCILCYLPCGSGALCRDCQAKGPLDMAWAAGGYGGELKRLVKSLKFERARQAAPSLAELLDWLLPELPTTTAVVFVPTANSRRRQRGYDQSELIARALAGRRGWPCRQMLERSDGSRQMGSGRRQRLARAKTLFKTAGPAPSGAPILLVDDVATTGASLGAAAKVLKAAGASQVMAAVCAVSGAGRVKM